MIDIVYNGMCVDDPTDISFWLSIPIFFFILFFVYMRLLYWVRSEREILEL